MSDTQIATWETEAKTGLLNQSPILGTILDQMRTLITNPITDPTTGKISGDYYSAGTIGITTGTGWQSYTEGGKLYLDETTLRSALAADPSAMQKIFGQTGSKATSQGIAVRLKTVTDNAKTSIETEAGIAGSSYGSSYLDTRISDYTTQISDVTRMMSAEETRYYNQFNAMESALSKLNQQASWLSQQTGTSSSTG